MLSVSGDALPPVSGHPVLIELALRNLVENALRHTPHGTEVEVQTGHSQALAWLQVCDTGAASGQAKPVDALGLGHKIVSRVAEVHAGRFERIAPETDVTGSQNHWQTCYRLSFAVQTAVGGR